MILNKKVELLNALGKLLANGGVELDDVLTKTEQYNPWFTRFHCELMLKSFIDQINDPDAVLKWLLPYDHQSAGNKSIGLVLAGNVPFVGMHDLLCVLMSGHRALVKLSSKDMFFFPFLHQLLMRIDGNLEDKIVFTEKLENFDAVIATGSRNSSRYFEYYFGKYPHIIRKNRTSVAILNGDETEEELLELGKDVFYYYGLGCRNAGKIFIPEDFDPEKLFRIWEAYRYVSENSKYKNNYDYNRAILLLNQTPHLANDFFMMVEDEKLFSPLACLYYERYANREALQNLITGIGDDLQCVVASGEGNTPFGQTQFPLLWDYADHVDTMAFLQTV